MYKQSLVVVILFILGVVPLASSGELTPPGPPAPTKKVEARTPIESIPYTISSSGSYY
jgi:hypothetical protein